MGDGGWHLSSRTICPICKQKIRRGKDSYATNSAGEPVHFHCRYPDEMAVTNGAQK